MASVPIESPLVRHQLEHSDEVLVAVHHASVCRGRSCPIHNLTDHSMRSFPQHFREDAGKMERICPHGVGHPDPDDMPYQIMQHGDAAGVHGCDGCCAP